MVKVRPKRGGNGWEYDIRFRWPDGSLFRERANAPVTGKTAAVRWATDRERELLTKGKEGAKAPPPVTASTVPTFGTFWPRVVSDHYIANRLKLSTRESAESIAKHHLLPALARKGLDEVTTQDIQALKAKLSDHSRKTVNNVLGVLARVYTCAVKWRVLPQRPFDLGMFKVASNRIDFYEAPDLRRLLDGARKVSTECYLACLLAGSAGLRRGEIIGLRWTDLDLVRGIVHIEQATYKTVHVDTPKSGHGRQVPMTPELRDALKSARVVGVDRVILGATNKRLRTWFHSAQRRAGLPVRLGLHMLRHTFGSHLAMAGVPARVIQELMGHSDLTTTQKYMHLAPGGTGEAIRALQAYTSGTTKLRITG